MGSPWLKFYPSDWRADPALRMCSLAARGLWMEMLCLMHEAVPRGSLLVNGQPVNERQLASLCGVSIRDVTGCLQQLEDAGVFSREDNRTIYSRRMRRDEEKAERDKANGKGGGHPDIKRGTVPKEQRVRRFRRSDAPAKAQRIFDRSNGACHWCQKSLNPDHYHIDHVVAVRDGGSNDENNLVASCPDCNGERAMTWGRNDSDLMVGNGADHKAQIPEARNQKESEDAASAAPTGKYAFDHGIIRLTAKDFSKWEKAFSYLDLRAELMALAQWAAEQGPSNWFFAVSGALAKRNRDQKFRLEQARQGGPQLPLTPSGKPWPAGIT